MTMTVTSTSISEELETMAQQVCIQRSRVILEKEVVAFISTVDVNATGMS